VDRVEHQAQQSPVPWEGDGESPGEIREAGRGASAIFHLVDCATAEGYVDREKPIDSHQLGRAIRFSEYLETHAERVYSSGTFGTMEAVKLIRARIVKGDLADGFSARDIYHPQWAGLTDANLVNEAVEMMVDMGWIRPRPLSKKGKARTAATYEINPKLTTRPSTDP
jgi:hypothetical protein